MIVAEDRPQGAAVGVAFSGGRDSLALLHVTCHAARRLGLPVLAIHVHHGLLPQADGWQRSARRLCARWRARGLPVRLRCQRVQGAPSAGESIEAWARRVRYAAMRAIAHEEGVGLVLLGHHRRDQAETVLLQALRAGGPSGLAAMPRTIERDGIVWARPWLEASRESIEAYLRRHRLKPVEDPSNAEGRLARSRLRTVVWPSLLRAFPDAEVALEVAARRAHEAAAILDEVAALDLAPATEGDALLVEPWLRLSQPRRANALRAWLRRRLGRGAPQSLVDRLLAELPSSRVGRWPLRPGEEIVLYRGRLTTAVRRSICEGPAMPIDLSVPGQFVVEPWSGRFLVRPVGAKGVRPAQLRGLRLAARQGGEQFQYGAKSVPRSLKKQYQARAIPAGDRRGPLVWCGDELVYVPGLGIDARFWAPPGEPQLSIEWIEGNAPE